MIALVSQENAVISLKTETKAERNRTEEDSWCVAAAGLSFSIFPQKSAVERLLSHWCKNSAIVWK